MKLSALQLSLSLVVVLFAFVIFAEVRTGVYTSSMTNMRRSMAGQMALDEGLGEESPEDLPPPDGYAAAARNETSVDMAEQSEPTFVYSAPLPAACNRSMEYFRGHMSEECKQLWRPDVLTRALPRYFNYVHVPKAGTSFTTTLRNYLPACKVKDVACPRGEISDSELWCNKALGACNGHHHMEAKTIKRMQENPKGGAAMVSMLRDPAARIVSAKNHDCHRHSGKVQFHDMEKPCEEYDYAGFAELSYIQNCQTKMMHKYFCAGTVDVSKINLAEAKQNLFNIDFFGITDDWDKSIRMFHCQFGGELRASELLNSRPGDYDTENIAQGTLDYIRDLEKMDTKLFDYAQDLFNKRFECMKCPADCV